MTPDHIYEPLNELREKYRQQMNAAADKAQQFAATEEMDRVSEFSSESERKREAFMALNQAIKIVDSAFPSTQSGSGK
jgi:vacuolar-type H+-ATPase subunit D/Vma8